MFFTQKSQGSLYPAAMAEKHGLTGNIKLHQKHSKQLIRDEFVASSINVHSPLSKPEEKKSDTDHNNLMETGQERREVKGRYMLPASQEG